MGIPIQKYVSGLLGAASSVASIAKGPIRMAIGKAAIASVAAAAGAGGATYATRKYYKRKQKKEQSNGSDI